MEQQRKVSVDAVMEELKIMLSDKDQEIAMLRARNRQLESQINEEQ
ncbi:hypothetical protein LC065_20035 (plasmid) [Halobacillus litoralis]|nr:hypothetical protein [Halobacillus litoralis]WLR49598.1 hypothetical protein LC065_20035 [Halobacillus litoralis]